MPEHKDLREQVNELSKLFDASVRDGNVDGALFGAAAAILQCEQLQHIGHTLHQLNGSLEALIREIRNGKAAAGGGYRAFHPDD